MKPHFCAGRVTDGPVADDWSRWPCRRRRRADTVTVFPVFTLVDAVAGRVHQRVGSVSVYVRLYPSALFTVIASLLTAVTSPRWVATVW